MLSKAIPARNWTAIWVYFTAPLLGMSLAAELYVRLKSRKAVRCAKLHHHNHKRCIFRCGYRRHGRFHAFRDETLAIARQNPNLHVHFCYSRPRSETVASELSQRLIHIFLRNPSGNRPVHGGTQKFQTDPHWRELILFYEYFHSDSGAGIGASHQTGWTGLVAKLIKCP